MHPHTRMTFSQRVIYLWCRITLRTQTESDAILVSEPSIALGAADVDSRFMRTLRIPTTAPNGHCHGAWECSRCAR